MNYEVAVIGAGPGGLVAALYLRRFMRNTVLASSGAPRASWIPRTHNILGYRGGISGAELLRRLHQQIDECGGVDRKTGECCVRVRPRGGFDITCGKEKFSAARVILATGMTDVQPDLKNLVSLRRRGLLRYCPVCDAFEYRNKKLLVLAQDAHGLKTATFLSGFAKDVSVLWLASGRLPARLNRARTWRGGEFIVGSLEAMSEKKGKLAVRIGMESGKRVVIGYDAAYVAMGSTINDSAWRHLKKIGRDEDGCIMVDHKQETGQPGVYAVGDCVRGLAQISVAAGQAAIAATKIHNELRKGKGR